MGIPLFILQAAIAVGYLILYGGGALLILFTVGFSAFHLDWLRNYFAARSDKTRKLQEWKLYLIAILLGVVSAILSMIILFIAFLFIFGGTPID